MSSSQRVPVEVRQSARSSGSREGRNSDSEEGARWGGLFPRLLTDVTGPFYTLVLELTVPNLGTFESYAPRLFGDKDWQANYQKMAPLVESGYREVFTIVD